MAIVTAKENDALCAFFKATKQVKVFTVPLQIEIRNKISNLGNKYEIQNYNTQSVA